MSKLKSAIVYIDGFNFYHGLKGKGWNKYLWLDLKLFSKKLLPPKHKLSLVRYFTSRIKAMPDDPDKVVRQSLYLDALTTSGTGVKIEWGNYQVFQSHCRHCDNPVHCPHCGEPHIKPNEKKTDVNIAVFMLSDAFESRCDTQILVSGDSDYQNVLCKLRELFPKNELIVAFPPKRKNNQLNKDNQCTDWFMVEEYMLKSSQLPESITFKNEYGVDVTITKPPSWL